MTSRSRTSRSTTTVSNHILKIDDNRAPVTSGSFGKIEGYTVVGALWAKMKEWGFLSVATDRFISQRLPPSTVLAAASTAGYAESATGGLILYQVDAVRIKAGTGGRDWRFHDFYNSNTGSGSVVVLVLKLKVSLDLRSTSKTVQKTKVGARISDMERDEEFSRSSIRSALTTSFLHGHHGPSSHNGVKQANSGEQVDTRKTRRK
ncbi:hypothetical protein EV360DRAFT_68004 [Lentinula raphanica]|nr:hypothetical protein EV360DRAFT_68004 [Lentinula raphanica]